MNAGELIDLPAEPYVPADTAFYDAGPIRIGVERRHITEESIRAMYASDPEKLAEFERRLTENDSAGFEDQGLSVHIVDAATGLEHLRFDCFDNDPHYHYIFHSDDGRETQRWIRFDDVANGPMTTWVRSVVTQRLAPMLVEAGVPRLASDLDARTVARVLDKVPELAAAG